MVHLVKDCFVKSAETRGEKTALSFLRGGGLETEISYSELNQDSNRTAGFFLNLGIKKGDRVLFYLEKSLVFVVAYLGLPDENWGEKVVAAVVVRPGSRVKPHEIRMHLKE